MRSISLQSFFTQDPDRLLWPAAASERTPQPQVRFDLAKPQPYPVAQFLFCARTKSPVWNSEAPSTQCVSARSGWARSTVTSNSRAGVCRPACNNEAALRNVSRVLVEAGEVTSKDCLGVDQEASPKPLPPTHDHIAVVRRARSRGLQVLVVLHVRHATLIGGGGAWAEQQG